MRLWFATQLLLTLLSTSVEGRNLISRYDTESSIVFQRGDDISLKWSYHLPPQNTVLKEFFCGYRNMEGSIFPLALDFTGTEFISGDAKQGEVNSDNPKDDKQLLRRITSSAEEIGTEKVRTLRLKNLQDRDTGTYFCGVYFTDPAPRLVYGGDVSLHCFCPTEKPSTNRNLILILSTSIPAAVILLLVVGVIIWRRKKTSSGYEPTSSLSLEELDYEDAVSSVDSEDTVVNSSEQIELEGDSDSEEDYSDDYDATNYENYYGHGQQGYRQQYYDCYE